MAVKSSSGSNAQKHMSWVGPRTHTSAWVVTSREWDAFAQGQPATAGWGHYNPHTHNARDQHICHADPRSKTTEFRPPRCVLQRSRTGNALDSPARAVTSLGRPRGRPPHRSSRLFSTLRNKHGARAAGSADVEPRAADCTAGPRAGGSPAR